MFQFHLATHDNKKALLSIKVGDKEIASVFDQNHKDNHKNSMAGTNVVHDVKRGEQVTLYAYTGTWLADFPANHYTHFVGLLLQPSQEEVSPCSRRYRDLTLLYSADGSDDEGGSRGCCCLDPPGPPGSPCNLLEPLL